MACYLLVQFSAIRKEATVKFWSEQIRHSLVSRKDKRIIPDFGEVVRRLAIRTCKFTCREASLRTGEPRMNAGRMLHVSRTRPLSFDRSRSALLRLFRAPLLQVCNRFVSSWWIRQTGYLKSVGTPSLRAHKMKTTTLPPPSPLFIATRSLPAPSQFFSWSNSCPFYRHGGAKSQG